jgi:glycosyltransferase involved in cell wall biosynthesis
MKLSAYIICFNAEDMIEACIDSIYPYIDELIIVEGSIEFTRTLGLASKNGNSSDSTVWQIDQYIANKDTHHKIKFYPCRLMKNRNELRQFALDKCTGDWIFLVDVDEFYTPMDMQILRRYAESSDPDIIALRFDQLQFWSWNVCTIGPPQERFFKYLDGIYYNNDPRYHESIVYQDAELWKTAQVVFTPIVKCLHLSPLVVNDVYYQRYVTRSKLYWAEYCGITTEKGFKENEQSLESVAHSEVTRLLNLANINGQPFDKTIFPVALQKSKFYQEGYTDESIRTRYLS